MSEHTPVGVAIGLSMASNEIDGSSLYVKTTLIEEGDALRSLIKEGEGSLHVVGHPGLDTYLSSCTAYNFAEEILLQKQPDNTFFANSSAALHLPSVNCPSLGCTVATSLLSFAMNKPVRKDLAMTGIITSTGRVLLVDGVKEKTIGARRSQIKTIILPEANRKDFDVLSEDLKEGLNVYFVDEYEQIFDIVFGYD